MGFLKLLLNANNAEGIREAMRMSYRKHRKQAERRPISSDTSPHQAGLFGAMGSRMVANNLPVTELNVWLELVPFLLLEDEEVAAEALVEYAVYVERTVDTKLAGLKEAVNGAVLRARSDNPFLPMVIAPGIEQLRWYALLDEDAVQRLEDFRAAPSEEESVLESQSVVVPGWSSDLTIPRVTLTDAQSDEEYRTLYLTAVSGAAHLLVPTIIDRCEGAIDLPTARGCAMDMVLGAFSSNMAPTLDTDGIHRAGRSLFETRWREWEASGDPVTALRAKYEDDDEALGASDQPEESDWSPPPSLDEQPLAPGERAVSFPEARAVGHLALMDDRAIIENGTADESWDDWQEARGLVRVGPGKLVRLEAFPAEEHAWGFLSDLGPDDLAAIELPENPTLPFSLLGRLTGLRAVAFYGGVSDAMLLELTPLHLLEHMWCLDTTELAGHGLDCLRGMPKLHTLDLANARGLTDSVFLPLSGHPALRRVRLSETPIAGTTLGRLSECPSLESLELDGTAVDDAALCSLAPFQPLFDIDLWDTKVGDRTVEHLACFPSLRNLNLGQTGTTDRGLVALAGKMSLERLVLSHTSVSDQSVETLSELSGLRWLNIEGTTISREGRAVLKQSLPHAKLHY